MWSWISRILNLDSDIVQMDWEIARHPRGFEVVVKQRTYNASEVIKIIREVTAFQADLTVEGHPKGCPFRRHNCYIRRAI